MNICLQLHEWLLHRGGIILGLCQKLWKWVETVGQHLGLCTRKDFFTSELPERDLWSEGVSVTAQSSLNRGGIGHELSALLAVWVKTRRGGPTSHGDKSEAAGPPIRGFSLQALFASYKLTSCAGTRA